MTFFIHCVGEKPIAISEQASSDLRVQSVVMPPDFSGVLSDYLVRDGEVFHLEVIPAGKMRVAVVCDYGINCGIATYSKYLCDQLRLSVGQLRIFAEDASKDFCLKDEADGVTRCWKRDGDYGRILAEVESFNPDLIIVQHEYGLFHKVDKFCALMSQLSRWRTVVTLHTVLEHDVECNQTRLDYTTRALTEAACREVIVHTPRARQTLRARGFSGYIHFIPHGCFEPSSLPRLPATKYGMFTEHSLFQYGFGGSHKGWEAAIEVVERLKVKYPDVMYVGIFNVSSFAEERFHSYHQKLLDLVKAKGLEGNVAIIRGYQSEQMLSNFLRSVKACLFLYKAHNAHWASWGASGAIQQPLSLGVPMVLSQFSAFQELEGKLPLCAGVDEAVELVDRIFSDADFEAEMRKKSLALAADRSWVRVASWYLECKPGKDYDSPCL